MSLLVLEPQGTYLKSKSHFPTYKMGPIILICRAIMKIQKNTNETLYLLYCIIWQEVPPTDVSNHAAEIK